MAAVHGWLAVSFLCADGCCALLADWLASFFTWLDAVSVWLTGRLLCVVARSECWLAGWLSGSCEWLAAVRCWLLCVPGG
jgi:hypothetical protein